MSSKDSSNLRLHEPLLSTDNKVTAETSDAELEETWLWRICNIYPRSLLFAMFCQYFNMGIDVMRTYCLKDLFKRVYEVEPA